VRFAVVHRINRQKQIRLASRILLSELTVPGGLTLARSSDTERQSAGRRSCAHDSRRADNTRVKRGSATRSATIDH
jgi:hypothetical protein